MLSIGIVNFNNSEELRRCLSSVFRTKGDLEVEVIVCDNNSSDGSPDMVEKAFPQVTLIRNSENLGLPVAVNLIIKELRGNYFLLLDSDTELREGALQSLLNFLKENQEGGIAGSRIYSPDGSIQETARRFPNFLSGLFGRRALMTRLFPGNPISGMFLFAEKLEATEPFEVDYVSAASMMMRRAVLDRVGPMDEDYFVYWSDVDWCRRVKDHGYRVFCVPSSRVVHHERYQPRKKKNPRMIVDFHRGAYLYYRKHNSRGILSPMKLVASVILTTRAALHLCVNHFRN